MPTPTDGSPGLCATPSPTGATAPALTQATMQVTAAPPRPRLWARGNGRGTVPRDAPPSGAGPPDPRSLRGTARRRGARHLLWEGGRGQRARGEANHMFFPCPCPFPVPCPASRRPLPALCPPPMMRHTNSKKWHHERRKNALMKQESGSHHRVWRPTKDHISTMQREGKANPIQYQS